MTPSTLLFVNGDWTAGDGTFVVEDKFTGEPVAEMAKASAEQVASAVGALEAAQRDAVIPAYERFEILSRAAELVQRDFDRVVRTMVAETGFTIADATNDVQRSIQTLRLSGEEATRLTGEMVPVEGAPGIHHRIGFTIRQPVGVVCAITPFNSPFNTVAHKVGPAIAAGNAVIVKPATQTPLSANLLVELLLEAGMPPSHIAIVHGPGSDIGAALLEDPRIDFYTFTGSTPVGRRIQQTVGLRRTQLELGGLSSTIVCEDADLDRAVDRCVNAAFRKAGQVCTSLQRLYLDERVAEEFSHRLTAAVEAEKAGDPTDPQTFVGPLISEHDVERVASWIASAVDSGARLLTGGERDGRVLSPAVVTDVDPAMQVMCQEIFGPVVSLRPYSDFDAVLDEVNDTPYGLAGGVFTDDVRRAFKAAERIQVGTLHINDTSSSRVDLMPYGGMKDSGFGQEGPRYAAREMTHERLVTITYG